MKHKLRGFKRSAITLDYNLYRVEASIPGVVGDRLSVIDIWPDGVDRTIVFVHGYLGCADTWEHQINHFANGYRVVAPDLRGHGQSDAPSTRYTMPELVADLHAITRQLKLPEKFVLVGHSFGGSICTEYAIAHPEQLERLILIATAGEYPLPRILSLVYRLPAAFFRLWWDYRPRWNAEVIAFKRMMTNNLMRWQGWPLLQKISVPTLVITGERDNYFPRRVYEQVGSAVPGAEVVDVGASKHKVQLERHQAVNRAIERFIETDPQRGSWRGQATVAGDPELLQRRPWLGAYHPKTPRTVPIPRQPMYEFLESAADWLPRRPATLFLSGRITYQQLYRQTNQFAHVLHGLGLKPGGRVMVVLPDMPQFIIAYYGALRSGGVVVLPNPDADASQIARVARETGAEILVTLAEFGPMAQAVRDQSGVREVMLADIANVLSAGAYQKLMARWRIAAAPADKTASAEPPAADGHTHDLARIIEDAPFAPPVYQASSKDLAAILYTSGTSDEPKGVCLTHANLVANTMQTRHWFPDLQYGRDTFLSVIPMLHSYGMTTAMNLPIALGASMVLLPVFDLNLVLECIRDHGPTVFPGVPAMYAAINQAPGVRDYGLSAIKACLSGSAPLPVEVQETFEKITQGNLVEGYGLTEASPVTHANPLSGARRSGSIGVPLPNTDAKIVDLASGQDLSPGQLGELIVRGPQVMQGYWQDEAASAEALQGGWLHTGDVAVMDADGFFHILGRKREAILTGAFSVYPRDVEEVLYENSKVQEVAVVGVPTAESGQRVKAFIVPRPGAQLNKDELLDLCRRRLEPYAVPWEIEFREELPKNFVGKVVRRMLLEEPKQGATEVPAADAIATKM